MDSSASIRQGWIYGPVPDLLFGCAGIYPLVIALLFVPIVNGWTTEWIGAVGAALGLAVNGPHYGATLLRVYQHREDRQKYTIFAVWISAALLSLFAVATRNPWLGSLLVTLYVTWSPWHFAGQNYGLAMMFLRRRQATVAPLAKRLFYTSFFLSFALSFFTIHGEDPGRSVAPVPNVAQADDATYRWLSLGIPDAIATPLVVLLGLAYVAVLVGAGAIFLRSNRIRDLTPAFLLVLVQATWFSVPALLRLTDTLTTAHLALSGIWIAAAHSMQYLWVTSYYARQTDHSQSLGAYIAKTTLAGAALLAIPALLFAPRALGVMPFEGFAILLFSVLNLHHFILDGAVWKLRDGRVARALIRNDRSESRERTQARAPGRSWQRSVLLAAGWSIGLASLAIGAMGHWEYEAGARALQRGDFVRAIKSTERLAAIGREDENTHTRLALAMRQRGVHPRLVFEHYQRSLEIRPTALTWSHLGRFHLDPNPGSQNRFAVTLPTQQSFSSDPEAALAAFQNALALDPTALDALIPAGLLLAERGDLDAAQRVLERAEAVSPGDPQLVEFAKRLSAERAEK